MTPDEKEVLLNQFRAYLDAVESGVEAVETENAHETEERTVDLYALFVELATLKNEVRIESRQVKTALDQFRRLSEPLEAGYVALQDGIESARRDRQTVVRETLRPLLLELLELQDSMIAALEATTNQKISGIMQRLFRKEWEILELWREGQAMALRRLDQILAGQGVTPLTLVDRPLDPRVARAVQVEQHEEEEEGIVLAEIRRGFLWNGALLRLAEVVVNNRP